MGVFSTNWDFAAYAIPPRHRDDGGRGSIKTVGAVYECNKAVFWTEDSCVYELTAVRTACRILIQVQGRQNLSMES